VSKFQIPNNKNQIPNNKFQTTFKTLKTNDNQ